VINWHIYNESLVRCGEIILDSDVIEKWNNELKNMNLKDLENHDYVGSVKSAAWEYSIGTYHLRFDYRFIKPCRGFRFNRI
jgi:hypothetical protein